MYAITGITGQIGGAVGRTLLAAGQPVRAVVRDVDKDEIAATFTKVLGRPVRAQIVPRDSWEGLFSSQGMKNPLPRIQMLDGFNEGWIEFESGEAGSQKGTTSLESVLRSLLDEKTDVIPKTA